MYIFHRPERVLCGQSVLADPCESLLLARTAVLHAPMRYHVPTHLSFCARLQVLLRGRLCANRVCSTRGRHLSPLTTFSRRVLRYNSRLLLLLLRPLPCLALRRAVAASLRRLAPGRMLAAELQARRERVLLAVSKHHPA